jgi:hypothetical protein
MIYQCVLARLACDHDGCKSEVKMRGKEGVWAHLVLSHIKEHAFKKGWKQHLPSMKIFCPNHEEKQ